MGELTVGVPLLATYYVLATTYCLLLTTCNQVGELTVDVGDTTDGCDAEDSPELVSSKYYLLSSKYQFPSSFLLLNYSVLPSKYYLLKY